MPDFSGVTEGVLQPFDELIKFWQGLGAASLPMHAKPIGASVDPTNRDQYLTSRAELAERIKRCHVNNGSLQHNAKQSNMENLLDIMTACQVLGRAT